jgi:putative Ca2+/H+ antiporter (TMEM165/GDT1 family)
MSSLSLLITAFTAILGAELAGDKSLYALMSLSARFRAAPVAAAALLAFAIKMGAAVLLGSALGRLPAKLVTGVSAASFATTALLLWRKRAPATAGPIEAEGWRRPIWVTFSTLALSEWADAGQLAAAAAVARFGRPGVVWLAGEAALATKAALALALGVRVRRHLSTETARSMSAAACLGLALATLLGID